MPLRGSALLKSNLDIVRREKLREMESAGCRRDEVEELGAAAVGFSQSSKEMVEVGGASTAF